MIIGIPPIDGRSSMPLYPYKVCSSGTKGHQDERSKQTFRVGEVTTVPGRKIQVYIILIKKNIFLISAMQYP